MLKKTLKTLKEHLNNRVNTKEYTEGQKLKINTDCHTVRLKHTGDTYQTHADCGCLIGVFVKNFDWDQRELLYLFRLNKCGERNYLLFANQIV